MTLEEMKARLAEAQDALRAMHEEAGDSPLGERQEEWDGLAAEVSQLRSDIAAIEARQAEVAKLGEKPGGAERKAPAFVKTHTDEEVFDLGELRALSYSGEDFLEKVSDNAKRAIERASFGVKDKEAAQERAEDLLDTVDNSARDLAKRMLLTGSKEYERAFTKVLRNGTDAFCTNEERQALLRAQALGTDASGGYAVPFQLDPTVMLTSAGVVNPIRELARVEQIVGKEWQGVTSDGTTVYRAGEAVEAQGSQFDLEQPTVRTNRVQGFTVFSLEIDLSWSALRSEITRMLVDAKAREENSFITGNGSGTAPGGIIGSADITSGQEVVAGTEDGFTVADLYAMEEALDARWEGNASWLAHKSVYNKIRQFPTDANATGGSMNNLFVESLTQGTPRRLLDYPTYRSTAMNSLTTALATDNTPFMVFGDFKQFLIVDRIGMTVELVPHVLGATNRYPTGQRGVYAVWMNNSRILIPDAFRYLVSQNASA